MAMGARGTGCGATLPRSGSLGHRVWGHLQGARQRFPRAPAGERTQGATRVAWVLPAAHPAPQQRPLPQLLTCRSGGIAPAAPPTAAPVQIGRERTYCPTPEDVGAILKFECTAYDAASPYPEVGGWVGG